jgi:hypothetical protein
MEQWFVAKGRGWRPDLPCALEANYRVYLQLHLLRTLHRKTWKFVEGILVRLFPLSTDYEFRSNYERCLRTIPEEEDWKVFLGPTYHIGQVLDVINENEGQVTYLEQCTLKKSQYRFGNLDIAPIDRQYVFHHGFNMTTVNGRTWTLENGKELKRLFKQYVRIYY